ncbi:MAG: FecR domain-containing protein [Paraglaciecola sp.]|nr:FecR domain-containing protein [Paraglaciecola sp.]
MPSLANNITNKQTSTSSPTFKHVESAAHWHILINSDEVTCADESAFRLWKKSPENAEAYRRIELVWASFDSAESAPARNTIQSTLKKQKYSLKSSHSLVLAIVSITTLLFGINSKQGDLLFADYSTSTGQQQLIILPDNSQVHLNTSSKINVDYSNNRRNIYLLQGEISLNVVKDTSRPFTVFTEHGSAQALGTRYVVLERNDSTQVSVSESNVKVCPLSKTNKLNLSSHIPSVCQKLASGEQTSIRNNKVAVPRAIENGFVSNWQQHKLIVEDQL